MKAREARAGGSGGCDELRAVRGTYRDGEAVEGVIEHEQPDNVCVSLKQAIPHHAASVAAEHREQIEEHAASSTVVTHGG